MPWPASSSRSASRDISSGPPAPARAWPLRGKPLRSTAAPGSASRRSRTTDRTTGTRLRTRRPHLPGHTRCRHRAGPALFAPANWTPIRGYGRYSSCLFASPHTSAERHRGSGCRRTLTLPSPQGLPASPKQTSDTFTPRVLGRTRPLAWFSRAHPGRFSRALQAVMPAAAHAKPSVETGPVTHRSESTLVPPSIRLQEDPPAAPSIAATTLEHSRAAALRETRPSPHPPRPLAHPRDDPSPSGRRW